MHSHSLSHSHTLPSRSIFSQVMMYSATLEKTVRPICRKFCQDVRTYTTLLLFITAISKLFLCLSAIYAISLFCHPLITTPNDTFICLLIYLFFTYFFPLIFQPMEIFVDDDTKLTLHGLQQYYIKLDEAAKNR